MGEGAAYDSLIPIWWRERELERLPTRILTTANLVEYVGGVARGTVDDWCGGKYRIATEICVLSEDGFVAEATGSVYYLGMLEQLLRRGVAAVLLVIGESALGAEWGGGGLALSIERLLRKAMADLPFKPKATVLLILESGTLAFRLESLEDLPSDLVHSVFVADGLANLGSRMRR